MRALRLCSLFLPLLGFAALAADAKPDELKETGPLGLLIQYRCPVAKRVDFRRELRRSLPNFEALKSQGAIARYHLLYARYVDSSAWDAMAIIEFARYDGLKIWKKLETQNPAGLNPEALALVNSIDTYPTDVARQAEISGGVQENPSAVYMVIPYSLTVTAPTYLKYADDYVIPQFEGWRKAGVLVRYELHMQRYTAGRPWDAMLVLVYTDDDALGKREHVVTKVRSELAGNPMWKAISDNKQSVRTEKMPVIGDDLAESTGAKE